MLRLTINEEFLDNKEYLFRGESNNSCQQNYSKKIKLPFNSRFYSYEIFDNIYMFGNVAVYELSNSAKIWDYDDSVEEFVEEFNLQNYSFPELYKVYKINSLSELSEFGGDINFDYHDFYHACQLVAIHYLETNYVNKYDGIKWYESNDTPEVQCMIWNNNVVRRLSYKEAKQVINDIANQFDFDTIYRNDDGYGGTMFALSRTKK